MRQTKATTTILRLQAQAAKLDQQITRELTKELGALPGRYGFDSMHGFIERLKQLPGANQIPLGTSSLVLAGPRVKVAAQIRRKRAVINDAIRGQVKKLTEAGKTGRQIAKEVGISLPSVQNVKKALGLVKARK